MWSGRFNGLKGYKGYKFETSSHIGYYPAGARYYENGLFQFVYRKGTKKEPNSKKLLNGLRDILHFKGRYLSMFEHTRNTTTAELYCNLEGQPSEEMMRNLEYFLQYNL